MVEGAEIPPREKYIEGEGSFSRDSRATMPQKLASQPRPDGNPMNKSETPDHRRSVSSAIRLELVERSNGSIAAMAQRHDPALRYAHHAQHFLLSGPVSNNNHPHNRGGRRGEVRAGIYEGQAAMTTATASLLIRTEQEQQRKLLLQHIIQKNQQLGHSRSHGSPAYSGYPTPSGHESNSILNFVDRNVVSRPFEYARGHGNAVKPELGGQCLTIDIGKHHVPRTEITDSSQEKQIIIQEIPSAITERERLSQKLPQNQSSLHADQNFIVQSNNISSTPQDRLLQRVAQFDEMKQHYPHSIPPCSIKNKHFQQSLDLIFPSMEHLHGHSGVTGHSLDINSKLLARASLGHHNALGSTIHPNPLIPKHANKAPHSRLLSCDLPFASDLTDDISNGDFADLSGTQHPSALANESSYVPMRISLNETVAARPGCSFRAAGMKRKTGAPENEERKSILGANNIVMNSSLVDLMKLDGRSKKFNISAKRKHKMKDKRKFKMNNMRQVKLGAEGELEITQTEKKKDSTILPRSSKKRCVESDGNEWQPPAKLGNNAASTKQSKSKKMRLIEPDDEERQLPKAAEEKADSAKRLITSEEQSVQSEDEVWQPPTEGEKTDDSATKSKPSQKQPTESNGEEKANYSKQSTYSIKLSKESYEGAWRQQEKKEIEVDYKKQTKTAENQSLNSDNNECQLPKNIVEKEVNSGKQSELGKKRFKDCHRKECPCSMREADDCARRSRASKKRSSESHNEEWQSPEEMEIMAANAEQFKPSKGRSLKASDNKWLPSENTEEEDDSAKQPTSNQKVSAEADEESTTYLQSSKKLPAELDEKKWWPPKEMKKDDDSAELSKSSVKQYTKSDEEEWQLPKKVEKCITSTGQCKSNKEWALKLNEANEAKWQPPELTHGSLLEQVTAQKDPSIGSSKPFVASPCPENVQVCAQAKGQEKETVMTKRDYSQKCPGERKKGRNRKSLSSEKKKLEASTDQPVLTFQCPKCRKDFYYTYTQTARASFGYHVKACGKSKHTIVIKTESLEKTPRNRLTRSRIVPVDLTSNFMKNNLNDKVDKAFGPKTGTSYEVEQKPAKMKSKSTNKSPKKPKGARNSYMFFTHAMRPKIVQESPGMPMAEQAVVMGKWWRVMTPEEKKPYDNMAKKDMERYSREMVSCNESGSADHSTQAFRGTTELNKINNDSNDGASNEEVCSSLEAYMIPHSNLCKVETTMSQILDAPSSYPYAPMGHLWLDKSLSSLNSQSNNSVVASDTLNEGVTLIGRRWVWDEGYFVDDHLDPQMRNREQQLERSLLKGGCTCGANHSFTHVTSTNKNSILNNDGKVPGRARRSERSASTSYSSSVALQIANGQLDPHTLISCQEYEMGPEFRFAKKSGKESVQPFLVRVNPDVMFLADFHAHLCSSEIIGLLGGHYSNEEKCIYIQAAFPCKSTIRTDSGHTDVEMDPVGQIYATEAIANHGMSVVGWYHSHPDFQPNPSITDIDNQASYQHLFQGGTVGTRNSDMSSQCLEFVSPFVGLIVGTYDGKNPSSQSVMRWFHVRSRDTAGHKTVNFPMKLRTTSRHFRKVTYNNQSTEDNIRRSMTLRSKNIRWTLELRYLSCPISGVDIETEHVVKADCNHPNEVKGSSSYDVDHFITQSSNVQDNQLENYMGDDVQNQSCFSKNEKNAEEECSLSLIEPGESPLMLSESLFDQISKKQMWKFQSAQPLFFTDDEHSILEMKCDTVPYDVFAGIIWHAVEREQQMLPRSNADETMLVSRGIPASSRSILELLLRQSMPSPKLFHTKLYGLIHCLDNDGSNTLNDRLHDNDAAIFHNIDSVLGHYAPKSNRTNLFSSWSGAGDKGKISKVCNESSSYPWVDLYLTKVGTGKMKRGHKITSCLLRWACNMQLDSANKRSTKRSNYPYDSSQCNGLCFDHEQKLCDERKLIDAISPPEKDYLYFVSEVMRLVVARWKEFGKKASSGQGTYKRRGRPLKRLSSVDSIDSSAKHQ